MTEHKSNQSKPSDGPASSEFTGFANAPVNEDGTHVDFRDVPAYDAERDEAVKAPSSIAQFSTADQSTDGSPMANVPDDEDFDWDAFLDETEGDPDAEPDADKVEDEAPEDPATVIEESHAETSEVGDPETPGDPTSQDPEASPAEGKEGAQQS
jgi:hypothetical protein